MKTVDKVIGKFNKLVTELDRVAAYNSDKAVDISTQIYELQKERELTRHEMRRAENIRNNIAKLIGE